MNECIGPGSDGHWILNQPDPNINEELFAHDGRTTLLSEFLSLEYNTEVQVGFIDAWCCVLNDWEKIKERTALVDFFASTYTTVSIHHYCANKVKFWGLSELGFSNAAKQLHTMVSPNASRDRRIDWLEAYLRLGPNLNYAILDMKDLLSTFLERCGQAIRAAMHNAQLEAKADENVLTCCNQQRRLHHIGRPCDTCSRSWDKAAKWWDCGLRNGTMN
nr:uncharacterized protein LOC109149216 [Ipomoea batatas]